MGIRAIADQILELTVFASFTRIGYAARRRMFGWEDPTPGALAGRAALVTGPTSGLGRATTDELAALGARVILVGRSEERLTEVRNALRARHGADRFPMIVADMRSLTSVRAAVAEILASEPRLDVIVDNAGAIFPQRSMGPDGIESTFATLVVGPFVLVSGLLPLLRVAEAARVVAVTSGGMYTQRLDLEDLQSSEEPYSGARAYARAKRAQVALVREWARRLPASGITFNAMHPGWADTPGLADQIPGFYRLMRPLLRTPEQGVDTLVWLTSAHEASASSGGLFLDRRTRPFDRVPATRLKAADRRRLWKAVVDLSGVPDPAPDG